ncbi:MAG: S-adenosylmethionine:tRNA ribosyltransferase-isomerase, partial [Caulobacterales bacterium]
MTSTAGGVTTPAMRTDLFDFDLPEENIALRPVRPRDAARLLCVSRFGDIRDRIVRDLPGLFEAGDILVLNDSRVIPVALDGVRAARPNGEDVRVKVNLIERLGSDHWRGFARPGRRLRIGDEIVMSSADATCQLRAVVLEKVEDGTLSFRFDQSGDELNAAVQALGMAPLPPYIAERRPYDERDAEDYQTIYAAEDGSVAAPTA